MNSLATQHSKSPCIGGAKLCLYIFLAALVLSSCYILTTGRYNGDFMGVPVTLSLGSFLVVMTFSVMPYLVGYWIYRWYSHYASPPTVNVSNKLLGRVFFIVTAWFILLAIQYDVGAMGKGSYEAPEALMSIIQITNRISPYYLGVFFIVGYNGSKKTIGLGILLLLLLGYFRGSLGVIMYVLLALAIRNHRYICNELYRHFFKFVLIAFLAPFVVSQLYALRSEQRGSDNIYNEISSFDMVFSILAGRLSSISNSSFIIQEQNHFETEAKSLDPLYFQRQMLSPLFGTAIVPDTIPERLLINAFGGNWVDVSYMAGVPGNLAIAWFISPFVAIANAFTMIFFVLLSFYFANKLNLPYRNEVCFMLLLYPLTSGVGNEFSFIAVSMLALIILFKFLRLLGTLGSTARI